MVVVVVVVVEAVVVVDTNMTVECQVVIHCRCQVGPESVWWLLRRQAVMMLETLTSRHSVVMTLTATSHGTWHAVPASPPESMNHDAATTPASTECLADCMYTHTQL